MSFENEKFRSYTFCASQCISECALKSVIDNVSALSDRITSGQDVDQTLYISDQHEALLEACERYRDADVTLSMNELY